MNITFYAKEEHAKVNQIEKPKQIDRKKVITIKEVYLKCQSKLQKLLLLKQKLCYNIRKQKYCTNIMNNLLKMNKREIENNKQIIEDFVTRYDTLSMQELLVFLRVLNKS